MGLAEFVTCKYLQFIELVATNQISSSVDDNGDIVENTNINQLEE